MAWNGGTLIFDAVVGALLDETLDTEDVIEQLIKELEKGDWDGQGESEYFDHPVVQKVFKRLHPDW